MEFNIRRFFLVFFIIGIILLFSYLRIFDSLELPTFDLRYKLRPTQNFSKDIVIIEISDDTLKELGSWPIPRDFHAALVRVLKESGVRQIIFDIIFSDATSQDDDLALALRDAGNVYLPFVFGIDKKTRRSVFHANKIDLAVLEKFKNTSKSQGFISTLADFDGKYRFCPLFIEYNKKFYPHISLIAACDYLKIKNNEIKFVPGKFIKIGNFVKIPVDDSSRVLINYSGRWLDTFKHYSYYDVLVSYKEMLLGKKPRINLGELKGKVCFIGLTATATCDLNPTPIEATYPMVGSNANIFNTIVNNQPIARASRFFNIFILIIFSLATIFINRRFKLFNSSIFTALAILIMFLVSYLLFAYFGVWIDLFYPILVIIIIYLCLNLVRYIVERRKNELIERELSVAKKIQESFLPKDFPKLEYFKISALMVPARQIGGDLYDFIELDNGKIGLMIADVSGKGVPAALFMAKTISDFRYFAKLGDLPKEVLSKLNDKLSADSGSGIFVTMSYLILDTIAKKIIVSNAGHFSPIVIRKNKPIEMSFEFGPPLGILEGTEFSQAEFQLEKDDLIILYTDGVVEARSVDKKDFGKERLINKVIELKDMDGNELVNGINDDIVEFHSGTTQHDDFTIIVVKYNKKNEY